MTDPAQIIARDPAAARPATEPGRRRTAALSVTRRPQRRAPEGPYRAVSAIPR